MQEDDGLARGAADPHYQEAQSFRLPGDGPGESAARSRGRGGMEQAVIRVRATTRRIMRISTRARGQLGGASAKSIHCQGPRRLAVTGRSSGSAASLAWRDEAVDARSIASRGRCRRRRPLGGERVGVAATGRLNLRPALGGVIFRHFAKAEVLRLTRVGAARRGRGCPRSAGHRRIAVVGTRPGWPRARQGRASDRLHAARTRASDSGVTREYRRARSRSRVLLVLRKRVTRKHRRRSWRSCAADHANCRWISDREANGGSHPRIRAILVRSRVTEIVPKHARVWPEGRLRGQRQLVAIRRRGQ